jgi:hypothetical protein
VGIFLLRVALASFVLDCMVLIRQKVIAHFLFTPIRKGIERRFKVAVLTGYGFSGSGIVLSLLGMLFYEITKVSGSMHAMLFIFAAILFLTTLLWGLFIARDCTTFIPLLRKMREQEGKEETPEWERHA